MTDQIIITNAIVFPEQLIVPQAIVLDEWQRYRETAFGMIMEAIADKMQELVKTVYAFPAPSLSVPCGFVGWPTRIDFSEMGNMKLNSDTYQIPVYFVTGRTDEKSTRDLLSSIESGIHILDGNLDGAIANGIITSEEFLPLTVGGVGYMAVRFNYEAYS